MIFRRSYNLLRFSIQIFRPWWIVQQKNLRTMIAMPMIWDKLKSTHPRRYAITIWHQKERENNNWHDKVYCPETRSLVKA
jgi:hypothetical protein